MPIEMRCENFSAFRERLRKEGRYDEYAKRIVELRADGMTAIQARGKAMPEFGGIPSTTSAIAAVQAPRQTPKKPKAAPKPVEDVAITMEMFVGKECDERAVVKFVFEYMDVVDVKPEMAPSAGAWSMLKMCRDNPVFRAAFYQSIWPKLLPTKAQMDLQNQFADDGRDAMELIAKMKQQIAENPA